MNAAHQRIHEAALRLFAEKGATQLTVSELAEAAGVARGTVYAHVESVDALFEQVAAELSREMRLRMSATLKGVDDPALHVAHVIRLHLRRAHEEPAWGKFFARFSLAEPALQVLWSGPALGKLQKGVVDGRFSLEAAQVPSIVAMLGGGVLAAMLLVLQGHRTWREAGRDAAELALRALGIAHKEARRLAGTELPVLL